MHAGVGTALGGVCTMVGEPQNLIIAAQANWQFGEFAVRMSPVTVPVLISGILTCYLVEKFGILVMALNYQQPFIGSYVNMPPMKMRAVPTKTT